MSDLFKRQTLDQLCDVPENIIDVYIVERHIWNGNAGDGGKDTEVESKRLRRAEPRTIRDFLIDPVRSLLNDVLRQLAAPYDPSSKANPIGQGWWIQAEFGSGKSHLLSFIGALALGDKKAWDIVNELETKNKKGKRESLYQFYEGGLAKKSTGKSKGIFVAVKTLVGQGGGTIGVTDMGRKLTEYILDAVQDQYHAENGKSISVYPVEVLADRFGLVCVTTTRLKEHGSLYKTSWPRLALWWKRLTPHYSSTPARSLPIKSPLTNPPSETWC
jgi:hypothetical protein